MQVNRRTIVQQVLTKSIGCENYRVLVSNSNFFSAGTSIAKPDGYLPKRSVRSLSAAIGYTSFRMPIYLGVRMARSARDDDGRQLEALLRKCLGGEYANPDIWMGPDTENQVPNFYPLYKNFEVPGSSGSHEDIRDFISRVSLEFCALLDSLEQHP